MRVWAIVQTLLAAVPMATSVRAQQPTGEVFGKVTDQSSAIIPGVTVTLSSPVLPQPLVAVTSETGTYQFPRLEGRRLHRYVRTGRVQDRRQRGHHHHSRLLGAGEHATRRVDRFAFVLILGQGIRHDGKDSLDAS